MTQTLRKQQNGKTYPPEVGERAIRLVIDHSDSYPSQWEAITSIAAMTSCERMTALAMMDISSNRQQSAFGFCSVETAALAVSRLGTWRHEQKSAQVRSQAQENQYVILQFGHTFQCILMWRAKMMIRHCLS